MLISNCVVSRRIHVDIQKKDSELYPYQKYHTPLYNICQTLVNKHRLYNEKCGFMGSLVFRQPGEVDRSVLQKVPNCQKAMATRRLFTYMFQYLVERKPIWCFRQHPAKIIPSLHLSLHRILHLHLPLKINWESERSEYSDSMQQQQQQQQQQGHDGTTVPLILEGCKPKHLWNCQPLQWFCSVPKKRWGLFDGICATLRTLIRNSIGYHHQFVVHAFFTRFFFVTMCHYIYVTMCHYIYVML